MPSRRLSPARSLQKLRTVFSHSPTRPTEPASPSPLSSMNTSSSITSTSPTLTLSPTPSQLQPFAGFAGFNFGAAPSPVFASPEDFAPLDSRRVIRRKKSCVEIEIEQERYEFDGALVGLVEPRPAVGLALGGIEEVLCGKV